jgi:hypothetical protein
LQKQSAQADTSSNEAPFALQLVLQLLWATCQMLVHDRVANCHAKSGLSAVARHLMADVHSGPRVQTDDQSQQSIRTLMLWPL